MALAEADLKSGVNDFQRSPIYAPSGNNQILILRIRGRGLGDDRYYAEERAVTRNEKPQHTNDILDYFGIREGEERNTFLRRFGEPHGGADVVRVACRLADSYGLSGSYDETPREITEGFKVLAGLVAQFRGYSPVNVGGKVALVPAPDLDTILSTHGQITLKSSMGRLLIEGMGYTLRFVEGIRVYGF